MSEEIGLRSTVSRHGIYTPVVVGERLIIVYILST